MYWFASDIGGAGCLVPLNTHLFRYMADDPEATRMLLRVLNREASPSEFLTTPRLARIAARALRDRPDRTVATIKEIARAARRNARCRRQRREEPPGMTSARRQVRQG
jgi:hypothetical protein